MIRGNRLYWLLAIITLPISAILAYSFFPVCCRCLYGAVTGRVFYMGIYLIWIRLFVGLILGENWKKAIIYMIMPFVMGLVVNTIGSIMWPHAH